VNSVIVYVHMEHERLREDASLWRYFATKTLEAKYRLEAISGEPCLIVRYDLVSPALLRELDVQAVMVGGHYTHLGHYDEPDLAGARAILRAAAWPTLGICGGFHLMAQTYGADVGPMESDTELTPETPMPLDDAVSGGDVARNEVCSERGFMPVRVLESHALFDGLGQRPVVYQLHSWEVKSLPRGFRGLAESALCRVQAVAHDSAPLFGTQFHPEAYDDEHPDGRRMLENFFRLARKYTKPSRSL
jgi:GMP synthase-like glutamine amidotransferase